MITLKEYAMFALKSCGRRFALDHPFIVFLSKSVSPRARRMFELVPELLNEQKPIDLRYEKQTDICYHPIAASFFSLKVSHKVVREILK